MTKDEIQAWDLYAAAALSCYDRETNNELVKVKVAAKVADMMILERRYRRDESGGGKS